jgi:hypothetical protein
MADDPIAAAAASVLPDAEVAIEKTVVVEVTETKTVPAAEPAEESKETEEPTPKVTELKDDGKHTRLAIESCAISAQADVFASAPTTNGDTEPAADATEAVGVETDAPVADADMEMKDADEAVDATPAQPEVATPAPTKKTPNGSAKKKGTSVPEHKNKKLNKKKSKPTLRLHAQPGELYLARMKGHAPWPSIICDEEMLPESLLKSRPMTTPMPDGTFKKPDYAPGGKREHERTYPVMFL